MMPSSLYVGYFKDCCILCVHGISSVMLYSGYLKIIYSTSPIKMLSLVLIQNPIHQSVDCVHGKCSIHNYIFTKELFSCNSQIRPTKVSDYTIHVMLALGSSVSNNPRVTLYMKYHQI